MNDEDIILLQDFIDGKIAQDKLAIYKGGYKLGFFYTKALQQAIENLIKGYKELKEENNRIKSLDYTTLAEEMEMGLWMPRADVEEYYIPIEKLNDYIPKSKVREKIKELQEEYIQLFELERKDGERETDCKIVIGEMEILEKLLQEGDDK